MRRLQLITFIAITLLSFSNKLKANAEALKASDFVQVFDSVSALGKFVEVLDSGAIYNLPIGIMGKGADPNYAILINEVKLTAEGTFFSASMVLTNPFDKQKLVFAANEVPFSFSGGIEGDFRLELINEEPVSISKDIGLEILAGSYVECDCRGFKSLKLKGNVNLNEKTFKKANEKGERLPGKVSAFFETVVTNWNDLVFSVSLPPFQVNDLKDFTFKCENLSVDISDLKNPTTLKFPEGYSSLYSGDMINLWRGIYIGNAEIILSEKYNEKGGSEPLAFGANDLIIDENGFSGQAYAENILSLEKGQIGGWAFAISKISVNFETNNLKDASLAGKIHIPVFDDSTNFDYTAFADADGNFQFKASPDAELEMNLWGKTELTIAENSYIKINSDSNGFVPEACFSGQLTLNASFKTEDGPQKVKKKKKGVTLPGIEFQDL
ncbi:MAG: hypothetical protein MI922_12755, partial [Bacteroidales bacterium]|nr:hypothetical protein [Bacteroidales bacterium]